ncbi:unnamed protein product [Lactuca virosa]|uniref:Uncharacterized protein n=1 Tax=Lactuca virosa TaxID=75947 RepID=A0AAU9NZ20_9ASTR|nr:unnamed protein product [Lactuca virosa]
MMGLCEYCPLVERYVCIPIPFEPDFLESSRLNKFGLKCPKITTLALNGCKMYTYVRGGDDRPFDFGMLFKVFHELKYVDFSGCTGLTGRELVTGGGGNNLEVMILRNCEHLKQVAVEQFIEALIGGHLRLLRHLDISNIKGLALDDGGTQRSFRVSPILIQQLLEQRPNFCLVAEFSDPS